MAEPATSPGNFVPVLGAALDFSADDLAENRGGLMSASQREKLKKELPMSVGCMAAMAVGMVAGSAAVTVSVLVLVAQSPSAPRLAVLPVPVVLFAVSGYVLWVFVRRFRKAQRDVREGSAVRMEGPIEKREEGEAGAKKYLARLGDLDLPPLTKPAFDALEEGRTYRVFLSYRLRSVLSLEPVDPPGR